MPHGGANPYDPRHALLRHLHRLLSSRGYGQYRSLQPRPGIARVPWPSKDLSSRQPLHDPPPNAHPAMFKFYLGSRPSHGRPKKEPPFSGVVGLGRPGEHLASRPVLDPHCFWFLEAFNARARSSAFSEHLGHLVARAVDLRDAQWRFSRSTPSLRTGAQSPRSPRCVTCLTASSAPIGARRRACAAGDVRRHRPSHASDRSPLPGGLWRLQWDNSGAHT